MDIMKKLTIKLLTLMLLTFMSSSCTKTLDIDYDNESPLIVVDGEVSNEGIIVHLSRTSNMTDTINIQGFGGATVSVSGSDGYSEQLAFRSDGWYHSPTKAKGKPGVTYTLRIQKGDTVCTAQSTMPDVVPIDSVRFRWMNIINNVNIRMLQIFYTDPQDTVNYYSTCIYRNGKNFKWTHNDDKGWSPFYNFQYIGIMGKEEADDAEKEKADKGTIKDDILYEGDKVVIELRNIDKGAYDYIYTASLNTSSAINPTTNLHGKYCLGYFSAFSLSKVELTYSNK